MARDPRAHSDETPHRRADGVTIAPAPGSRKRFAALLAAALLAGLAVFVLLWGLQPKREAPRAHVELAPPPSAAVAAAPPQAHPVPARVPSQPPPAPAPLQQTPEGVAPAEDAAPDEHPPFPIQLVPSGIGLFPPPSTDPIKLGIVVPDGFELPEGYVRHYQLTDDGQELPPILMFHPDYDWVDDAGNRIDPGDRVVSPELAPKGMPIEMLEPPADPSEH
jgi:hypothetical protein